MTILYVRFCHRVHVFRFTHILVDEDTNMMSPGRYNGQNPQMNPMTPTQMRARENSIGSWTDPYSPGGAYAQLGPDTMRCSIGSIGSMSSLGTLGM